MGKRKEKLKFRCMACLEERSIDDAVCWGCVMNIINNHIQQAVEPIQRELEELRKDIETLTIHKRKR